MPRHPEPQFVKDWRDGPPRCCHTCEHYRSDGRCQRYDMEPPEEFAATPGQCRDWSFEVPF